MPELSRRVNISAVIRGVSVHLRVADICTADHVTDPLARASGCPPEDH
ncbi:hypothetical protein [Sulfitobacter sp.]